LTRALLPRANHPLSKPLWDIRLQAMWIAFTGLYVIIGTTFITANPAMARLLSSAFLTIAGGLVLLLMCHTVIATDRNASRKTLLVALTACLFFVQKSYDTYHDVNGLIFAIIFSAIILTVVWLPDESAARDRIMLTSIAVLLAAIAFSCFQLIATVIEQRLIRWQHLPPQAMIVSPHVAGILSGMMSFLVLDSHVAKSVKRMRVPGSELSQRFFLLFASALTTVAFTFFANEARFKTSFLDTGRGVVFACGYVTVQIFLVLICIWTVCRAGRTRLVQSVGLLSLAWSAGLALAAMHHLLGAPNALQSIPETFVILYCLPAVSLVAASALCTVLLIVICNHLYQKASDSAPPLPERGPCDHPAANAG
jgi:hypothetical protein